MSPAIPLRLMLVGDLILDEPDPDSFFEPARSVLHQADLLVGHVEVPHTLRGRENTSDVPAPPSDPGNLSALKRAGFHVARWPAITSPMRVRGNRRHNRHASPIGHHHNRCWNEPRRSARAGDRGASWIESGNAQLQLCRPQGFLGKREESRVRLCSRDHPLRTGSCFSGRASTNIHFRRT